MSTTHSSPSHETPTTSAVAASTPSACAPALTPSEHPLPNRVRTVALVVFASVYAAFFPLRLGHHLIASSAAPTTNIGLYVALFAVGCVAFRHPLSRAARQVAAHKRRAVLTLVVGGIATTAIDLVGTLTSSVLLSLTGLSEATLQNDSNVATAAQLLPPVVVVVVLGVVGPIVEEMVFRHLLIGLIRRVAPTWTAVVVSSALFGVLHMNSFALSEVLGVVPHVFFGLAMGVLYVRTDRNLLYPATLHCLNNLNAFLPLVLG